ncbi:MAG: phosphoenolpyruvate--protein phosphotransferase [Gammaproteobacteria bacterium]|nr:phosphoenolpyruvate--protein phosphotransferase [Gammaproteobacteria bacterium]
MLETLRRIVQEVSAAEDLNQALNTIVLRVKQVMNSDVCSVYLTDHITQTNILMATDGLNPDSVFRVRLKLTEGLIGLVTRRAEPINLDNAPIHPDYKFLQNTGEEHYHGFCGVPVIHHRQVLGVLVVQRREQRQLEEDELTLLVTMAAQLAGAIAHAQALGSLDDMGKPIQNSDKPFRGLPGAPGVGIGTVVVVYPPADLAAVPNRFTDNVEEEVRVFRQAVTTTLNDIEQLKKRISKLPSENSALIDAYTMILKSNSLLGVTIQRIRKNKVMASTALRDTVHEQVHAFDAMEDAYLRQRSDDIRDLGNRILVHIQSKASGNRTYPEKTILVSEELTASAVMEVPPERLAGVVSTKGSGSSHAAILARALGVPAVMGAKDLPCAKLEAEQAIVDGYQGLVYRSPSSNIIDEYKRLILEEQELSDELRDLKDKPAETLDSIRIPLYVNSGLLSDITSVAELAVEGIGLYRTEFPFMIRDRFPGEDEQTGIYRQVLEQFSPRPVTLRTLDIGGDKSLSYFPIKEDNPFLGWRGIRISLDRPDIFLTQIRAMLRASEGLDNLHILLPMISSVTEVDEALKYIHRARTELLEAGHRDIKPPKIGAMIEVPSAVYQADVIAKRVDYLSIGTNDLVQYLLAVDRNNSNVADLFDCLHPAVIQAVQHVVQYANKNRVHVTVCGEMAGDPAAAILLVGMGLDCLSMSIVAIPRIKWVIRNISFKQANALLNDALQMNSARDIRNMLTEEIVNMGLGGLIRPGKL